MSFELQLDPRRIPEFAARYSYEDDTVLEAGRRTSLCPHPTG